MSSVFMKVAHSLSEFNEFLGTSAKQGRCHCVIGVWTRIILL